jgi:hypothetical protein
MPRTKASRVKSASISREAETEADEDGLQPIDAEERPASLSNFGNLRDLIFLGRMEVDVVIESFTFNITTLSSLEQKEIVRILMAFDDNQRLANVRDYTLAQCIRSVNGVPIDDLCDGNGEVSVSDRVEALSYMQNSILDKLFLKYNDLVNETDPEAEESLKK